MEERGSDPWEPAGSGKRTLRGGPEPCSRLAWFRTLSLHAPPPVNECRSTLDWEPGGPDFLLT